MYVPKRHTQIQIASLTIANASVHASNVLDELQLRNPMCKSACAQPHLHTDLAAFTSARAQPHLHTDLAAFTCARAQPHLHTDLAAFTSA
eukprot:1141800-Pelagomonas_calceolata.AAC.1